MPNFFKTIFFVAGLSACGQESVSPAGEVTSQAEPITAITITETQRLNQWFDERNEEALAMSPMLLTSLGRKDQYDSIDDASEAAAEQELRWQAQTLADLKANFDYQALSSDAKISYDLWVYQVEAAQVMAPFRRHAYIFEQMNGAQASLPNFLINLHKVDNEADMQAYITRIGGISHMLDQLLERAKIGAEEGVRPPQFAYEFVVRQATAVISGVPFDAESDADAPLWADAKTKIEVLLDAGEIDEAKAVELLGLVETALLTSFEPSYLALIAFIEADYENADALARGVGALGNGASYYQARLASMTTTTLTADEIHSLGLSEVTRIQQEMEALKDLVGFDGTLQDFFSYVKSNTEFRYPNDDRGRQGYLDDSTAFIDTMRNRLPDYFGVLPQAGLEVRRVEAFRERDGAPQHYRAGTPDGSQPGVYYAHLSDMNSMPKTEMESIAYHEGIPGHHLQISIQRELTGVPEFRTLSGFTAYSEGWGLYAEYLSKEMGAFEDPYKDFGRLNSEIWRAIRLVVDTGIHAKGWSQEQAVEFFIANSSISEGQIRAEVRRYFVMPGQATSYKIGMLKILELREKARNELGDQFDIRAFHDTVLVGGALPLSILERVVDEWIAETKV